MPQTWMSNKQECSSLVVPKEISRRKRAGKFRLPKIRHTFLREQEEVKVTGPALNVVEFLHLTQHHLRKLKKRFDKIDIDKSGTIEHDEFYAMVGENKSPLLDMLLDHLDIKKKLEGGIDFNSFVRVCLTYCAFTQDDILQFCFDCFDRDSSGFIDEDEYIELCQVVNSAAPMFPGNFSAAIEMFDSDDDGYIDYYEFVEFHRRFPLVFFPAFRLQDRMQQKTLGINTWIKVNRRAQLAGQPGMHKESRPRKMNF
mmetsp:Transcript_2030/g.2918  ORF Transcript_2030/g.2918 Transcript_2030/m.2918 type:complete len:255 (+) Transcript_2030:156-920(+)